MDELHSNGAFSHPRGHPLHRAMAHIPDGEDSRNIGFEQEGIALERPPFRPLATMYQVRAGPDETTVVPFYHTTEPIRAWESPNKDKHRGGWNPLDFIRVRAQHRNLFQPLVAVDFSYAGACPNLDVGRLLNLINQIFRHGRGKTITADYNHQPFLIFGKIHCRVPSRVGGPNDVDGLPFAGKSLGRTSTVVDAGSLQSIDSGSLQAAPLHAGCNQKRMTRDLAAVPELKDAVGALGADIQGFLRGKNLHPKTLRLHYRASRQIAPAQPGGKPQIVLDPRAHPGLPAGCFALDHHRVQAFGSAINSRRKASRTTADDCQVVKIGLRP